MKPRMKPRILPSAAVAWQTLWASWAFSLTVTLLAFGASARSQEPPPLAESIAEAARNAREQKSNSTKHAKIITNDDLGEQSSVPSASAILQSTSTNRAEEQRPRTADCDKPDDERLKMELQAAEEERDQIRRELSYQPIVISDGDVDLNNFKPGYSGLDVGSPPLLQTQPQAPARVTEVILEEKIASLEKAVRIACDSPMDAGIQKKLDLAEQELHLLQGAFALDQATYYSWPNYAEHTTDKAKLDAEQQQIQDLQSEIERLRDELAAPKTNQPVK